MISSDKIPRENFITVTNNLVSVTKLVIRHLWSLMRDDAWRTITGILNDSLKSWWIRIITKWRRWPLIIICDLMAKKWGRLGIEPGLAQKWSGTLPLGCYVFVDRFSFVHFFVPKFHRHFLNNLDSLCMRTGCHAEKTQRLIIKIPRSRVERERKLHHNPLLNTPQYGFWAYDHTITLSLAYNKKMTPTLCVTRLPGVAHMYGGVEYYATP